MNLLFNLADFIIKIDIHLGNIIQTYGVQTYILLFLIIFCETGLVFLPFLPGDSLVFAAGAFAAIGKLNVLLLYFIFIVAAFIGDTVNYHIGKKLGNKVENMEKNKIIKKEHIEKAEQFFKKHGGKSIVLARFMPIIRTFAPFIAGSSKMEYSRFLKYNLIGSILWITLFLFAGYYFGNIQFIKERFSTVILAIIFISLLPIFITFIKEKLNKKRA